MASSSAASPSVPPAPEQRFAVPLPLQRRRHRTEEIEAAYTLQRDAAIRGATAYTAIGATAVTASHFLFPRFRFQTLALKAFIVSGFTIFGFVVGADTVLLNHEGRQRTEEDLVRGVARRELAKKGILASEKEIQRWKVETRERLLRDQTATDDVSTTVSSPPSAR